MPFLIPLAIGIHIAVLAPLFLLFTQGEQTGVGPYAFLGWPLVAAIAVAAATGSILTFLQKSGIVRPLAVMAVAGLYLYLQFYVLVWDFGPFDGRVINFRDYRILGVVEAAILLGLLTLALLWPRPITGAVGRFLVILTLASTGFVAWQFIAFPPNEQSGQNQYAGKRQSDVVSSSFLRDRGLIPGILDWSKDKNVAILLLDTLQVDVFENIVSGDPKLKRQFSGFTLFTNASGHFPYTSLAIPAIVSGEPYDPQKEATQDYRDRVANKRFEAVLEKQGYQASRIPLHNRADFLSASTATCRRYGMAYDLYGFRQVPIALKPVFYDEGRFRIARLCGAVPTTESEVDLSVFDRLIRDSTANAAKPTVKFLHFWGAHPPAMMTSDCQVRKQGAAFGDFQGQAKCILHKTGDYLDKLRELGVLTNTMMFIISDHGSRYGFLQKQKAKPDIPAYVMSSANPSIAFHDFGAANEFRTSKAPVMLADIYATIMKRSGLGAGTPGPSLDEIPADAERSRPYVFFRNAGDAANKYLSRFDGFLIRGHVTDPLAWSRTEIANANPASAASLQQLDFASPTISTYLGLGWSAEAKGVAQSWIISSPAFVSGVLPKAHTIRVTMDYLNPHKDQSITIKLNGRELTQWTIANPETWTSKIFDFSPLPEEAGKPVQIEIDVGKIAFDKDGTRESGISVKKLTFEPVD